MRRDGNARSPTPGSAWPVLAGAFVCALAGAGRIAAPSEISDPGEDTEPRESAYERLISSLPDLSVPQRDAFAIIALDEMLIEHAEALEKIAEQPPSTARARGKQLRWANNTRRYAAELESTAARANSGQARIEVTRSLEGSVHVHIDEELLVVSTMNMRYPDVLGERIVVSWCAWFDCRFLEAGVGPVEQQGEPTPTASWSFGPGAAAIFRTSDGLVFEFSHLAGRQQKQQACLHVATELREIVRLIERVRRTGHRVESSELRLIVVDGRTRLVLDGEGTFVGVTMPALTAAPQLLAVGRAWVSARLSGVAHTQRFPESESMLQPLLGQ